MVGISDLSDEDQDALCSAFPKAKESKEEREKILQLFKEHPEFIMFPLTIQLARAEKANSRLGWLAISIACISLFIALVPVFHEILMAPTLADVAKWIIAIGIAGLVIFGVVWRIQSMMK